MSIRAPLTLLRLAGRSLLRDPASAIAAPEYLPAELFPQFFIQVFKAVLDGLDVLLAQEVRPRRRKLRVLDLRNTGANFWRMWCEDSTQKCSQTGPVAVHSSSPDMQHPLAPLEVFLDLKFNERDGDEFLKYILQWAQQREGLLHLCCKTLRIPEVPFQRVRRVLDGVQLDCIQEVEMLRLRHLRDLNMASPSFLRGHLDQMLRCLQTPLDKLSIINCQRLTHSDLTHLFQGPNLRQLKSLHLFGLRLADFSLEPLLALLEAVVPTLEDLGLDHCGMVDSHVEAILPVLSRCRQLREFTMSENNFSVASVEKLLRHTAGLRSLERELYPVPLECYRIQGTVNQQRLALIQAELTGTLRELGQPRSILLATKHCSEFYDVAFS
ncbi:PRAME family member 15-like [Myotis daubentonii]|uniref:PRAME family member 15-like n=1 Tax=Myotis daubentonii TaxID=98922 RepID=UPI0028734888|nr:PRAME family member 15-like [Myotis daubentonii]